MNRQRVGSQTIQTDSSRDLPAVRSGAVFSVNASMHAGVMAAHQPIGVKPIRGDSIRPGAADYQGLLSPAWVFGHPPEGVRAMDPRTWVWDQSPWRGGPACGVVIGM
jgi:hypothetical protein